MKTKLKYLEALKELQNILKYTDRISLTKFAKDNSLNTNFATVLIKGGIIECNGVRGRGTKYKWTTIDPNIRMAETVLSKLSNMHVSEPKKEDEEPKKKRGGKRVGAGRKSKVEENKYIHSYTTSFLFGLIKINTKVNYKSK